MDVSVGAALGAPSTALSQGLYGGDAGASLGLPFGVSGPATSFPAPAFPEAFGGVSLGYANATEGAHAHISEAIVMKFTNMTYTHQKEFVDHSLIKHHAAPGQIVLSLTEKSPVRSGISFADAVTAVGIDHYDHYRTLLATAGPVVVGVTASGYGGPAGAGQYASVLPLVVCGPVSVNVTWAREHAVAVPGMLLVFRKSGGSSLASCVLPVWPSQVLSDDQIIGRVTAVPGNGCIPMGIAQSPAKGRDLSGEQVHVYLF